MTDSLSERRSTPEMVAGNLRSAIMKGELTPGTYLREVSLANTMRVSRGALREAFRLLTQEGLLTYNAFQGVTVTTISPDDVEDIYRLRLIIEPQAIDAYKRQGRKEDLALIRQAADKFSEVTRAKNWAAAFEADLAFHGSIAKLLNSERLSECFTHAMRELRLTQVLYPKFGTQGFPKNISEHNAIAEALEGRKISLAQELVIQHLTLARDTLLELMETPAQAKRKT
jgi:DNA-binding GntR family transcriptional regulator